MRIKNIFLRHSLIYGGIIGATITVYQILLYIFGMTNNKTLENVALFLFVLGIFIAVRRYREIESNGTISFGNAFKVGILTCLFIAIIGGIYSFFQFKYLSPHLVDEIIELSQERLLNKGIPDSQVELQSGLLEKIVTPVFIAVASVFSSLFWGAITSLIVALLLKRDENPLLRGD